jgi:hypothetical protein
MTTQFDKHDVVTQVTDRLHDKFPDRDETRIEAIVEDEMEKLAENPVHDYDGVLAERAAKDRLRSE